MGSNKLKSFIDEIKFKNRNPKDNSVLSILDDIRTNPSYILSETTILYRARLFAGTPPKNHSDGFYGYSAKESFLPPREKTKDMRANYKYIPYLYCTDDPYGAVCETRPRFGALVSVSGIEITENMTIFDLTFAKRPPGMDDTKENLCKELSEMFAKPITEDDNLIDYIPTQYIAEYIKNLGYSGIAYKCAYSEKTKNIVIFAFDRCKPISSYLYKVGEMIINVQPIDQQGTPFTIKSDTINRA